MDKTVKAFVERDSELFNELVGDYFIGDCFDYDEFEALINSLPEYADKEWEQIVSGFEKVIEDVYLVTNEKPVTFYLLSAALSRAYTNIQKPKNNE